MRLMKHAAEKHLTKQLTAEDGDITFTDEDLMLRIEDHNRLLYMEGFINEVHMKRILINPGSIVNLLSFRTLKKLGRSKEHLEPENVT